LASDECITAFIKSEYLRIPFAKALKIYHTAQNQANLLPIEPEYNKIGECPKNKYELISRLGTIETVRFVQTLGYKTMALTARSFPIQKRTIFQLNQNGIDFTQSSPSKRSYILDDEDLEQLNSMDEYYSKTRHDCRYTNGILMCGNNDKGQKLLELLHRCNCLSRNYDDLPQVKVIIFVDDKEKNVKSVKQAIDKFNLARDSSARIIFIGLRYSRCDNDVQSFRLQDQIIEKANILLGQTGRSPIPWLSHS